MGVGEMDMCSPYVMGTLSYLFYNSHYAMSPSIPNIVSSVREILIVAFPENTALCNILNSVLQNNPEIKITMYPRNRDHESGIAKNTKACLGDQVTEV